MSAKPLEFASDISIFNPLLLSSLLLFPLTADLNFLLNLIGSIRRLRRSELRSLVQSEKEDEKIELPGGMGLKACRGRIYLVDFNPTFKEDSEMERGIGAGDELKVAESKVAELIQELEFSIDSNLLMEELKSAPKDILGNRNDDNSEVKSVYSSDYVLSSPIGPSAGQPAPTWGGASTSPSLGASIDFSKLPPTSETYSSTPFSLSPGIDPHRVSSEPTSGSVSGSLNLAAQDSSSTGTSPISSQSTATYLPGCRSASPYLPDSGEAPTSSVGKDCKMLDLSIEKSMVEGSDQRELRKVKGRSEIQVGKEDNVSGIDSTTISEVGE